MSHGLLELPPRLRRRLEGALRTGLLRPPYTAEAVQFTIAGTEAAAEGVAAELRELDAEGMPARACARWIQEIEAADARTNHPALVWSGPEAPGFHARDTRRVYRELFGEAEQSVWAATYVFTEGPTAFGKLADRMDSRPDLSVTLLLNIQRPWGDTTKPDQLVRRFAERFWKDGWPGVRRPEVYYDPRSVALEAGGGVLHAKAVVTDEEAVFVTSANLTEAAQDRNIEMGLLVRDRSLARTVVSHFRGLVDQSLLEALPPP